MNLLLLKKIKVQNANALSSPYTVGLPAMTAWLGFMHALQRRVYEKMPEVCFRELAVVCHELEMQTFEENFDNRLIMPKIPPSTRVDEKFIRKGGAKAFIPQASCHLTVTLLICHNIVEKDEVDSLCEFTENILPTMRIAGGDILRCDKISSQNIDEHDDAEIKKLTRQLMPGYFIKERRDLMLEAINESKDAIDALLSYLVVNNSCEKDNDGTATWRRSKKAPGWLVPIATGFYGLSELKQIAGQRDDTVPHRFAEAVVTLGEFVMPYRVKKLQEMFWHYHVDGNVYLCQQNKE